MSHDDLQWFNIQINVEIAQFILTDRTLRRKKRVKLINRPSIISLLNHSKPKHTSGGHMPEPVALCCSGRSKCLRGDGPISTEVTADERRVGHVVFFVWYEYIIGHKKGALLSRVTLVKLVQSS